MIDMDNIVLYSTHCPLCTVLEKKLNMKNIEYTICDDINQISSLGFLSVPVLQGGEDTYSFKEACVWLDGIEEEEKG